MVEVIPKHIKDVWDTWNIRGMIILSLSLQTILIFFAPFRKRTRNKFLIMLLWSSYLLADLSANFAVALIAKNQGKDPKPDDPPHDKKLVALWAPFLLLHLGGPDTITAFSLEDNALWDRHFLGLVFQALAGVYVVVQSLPNMLWVIILLLFIAGSSKYLERTIALYLASSDKFRGSILQAPISGFDYTEQTQNLDKDSILDSEMHVKEHHGHLKPLKLMHPNRELADLEILQYAFFFFSNFKSLMVNNIFSLELRDESKAFFSSSLLQDKEALRIIEAELDFLYEGLYTKGAVLHSWLGLVSRVISLGSLLLAFSIFHYRHNKIQEFHKADILITYTLFLVGIALDVISIHMFMISDWTAAILSKLKDNRDDFSWKERILNWILFLKRPKWKKQTYREQHQHEVLNTPLPNWEMQTYREHGLLKSRSLLSNGELQTHLEHHQHVVPCLPNLEMQTHREHHQHEVLNTPFLLRRWTGSIKMFNFITYSANADTDQICIPRGQTCQNLSTTFFPFSSIIHTWSENIAIWFCELHQQVINLPPGENQVARSIITIFKNFVEFFFHVPNIVAFLGTCLINFLGIKDLLCEIRLVTSVHSEPLTRNLWYFVFSELKEKSKILDSVKNTKRQASARRGLMWSDVQVPGADNGLLLKYMTEFDYDHSLLIWHIATELCYQKEASSGDKYNTSANHRLHNGREISKILSDYMMYLFIKQPKLMSDVSGTVKIRFRGTLAEAERLFKKTGIRNCRNAKLASEKILSVDTSIEPRDVKGHHSKSVLFEATLVAKELERVEKKFKRDKWETLSLVWLEFLLFAASRCDGTARMELLSKGGEFINFVWLLMAHLGLGDS